MIFYISLSCENSINSVNQKGNDQERRFPNYSNHPNSVLWEVERVNGLDFKMRIDY